MQSHINQEKTLVIIKPDGVQRNLIGEVISRYEKSGLKLIGLKMINANEHTVKNHYTLDPAWIQGIGKKTIKGFVDKGMEPPTHDSDEMAQTVLNRLARYMTSGPMVAMVWQGPHAVDIVRKITGGTEPLLAAVGTIRGDYSLDSYQISAAEDRGLRNVVHSSGSIKEAEDEIKHWFSEGEVVA